MTGSQVSAHVLDTTAGVPAEGVEVRLEAGTADRWTELARATTDADGRVTALGPERLDAGTFRLTFETGAWFASAGVETFFPYVTVVFTVDGTGRHLHVPLLLSPFAFSSYRGS